MRIFVRTFLAGAIWKSSSDYLIAQLTTMSNTNDNDNQSTPIFGDEAEVHDPSAPKPVKVTAPPAWPKKSTNLDALNDNLTKVSISQKPETKLVVDTGAFIAKVRIDNLGN